MEGATISEMAGVIECIPAATKLSSRANAFSIDSIISTKRSNENKEDTNEERETVNNYNQDVQEISPPEPISPGSDTTVHDCDLHLGGSSTTCIISKQLQISKTPKHPDLKHLECTLESRDLWRKFHDLGTEMIITKTGRRMFPTIRISFSHGIPDSKYIVVMDITAVDHKRYRYAYHKSSWLVAGKADPPVPCRLYFHTESSICGSQLTKQLCSFEKLKLTNNTMDQNGHVVLNSMHKYQPRIHVIRATNDQISLKDLRTENYKTFIFPETQFTAVTAYQNQLITRLKIDSNPFAKGFRDSSRLNEYERDSVENLLTERRILQPGTATAVEMLLGRSPQHVTPLTNAMMSFNRLISNNNKATMYGFSGNTLQSLQHQYYSQHLSTSAINRGIQTPNRNLIPNLPSSLRTLSHYRSAELQRNLLPALRQNHYLNRAPTKDRNLYHSSSQSRQNPYNSLSLLNFRNSHKLFQASASHSATLHNK